MSDNAVIILWWSNFKNLLLPFSLYSLLSISVCGEYSAPTKLVKNPDSEINYMAPVECDIKGKRWKIISVKHHNQGDERRI